MKSSTPNCNTPKKVNRPSRSVFPGRDGLVTFFLVLMIIPSLLWGFETSPYKIRALYNSLDPSSVSQHLAFYELYSTTNEGQAALLDAWKLMSGSERDLSEIHVPTFQKVIHDLVAMINKQPSEESPLLSDYDLQVIEKLAGKLPNRRLKGHYVTSESEVLKLPPQEIDLARGLFLSQLENETNAMQKLKSYEAAIDLMALQIRAKLPANATPEEKIRTINAFVFDEMGFRFPPHSLYAKDIDIYTFLPSVLDSRRGVCLGVSILYLCLAQRLNLPLEMITPPGHIYVRYRHGDDIINIETTARGIHVDSEEYLGIDTLALEQRNIKEVIGLAHFNQAAVYLKQDAYPKALACYEKAQPYLPEDMLLKEVMGYTCVMCGQTERGRQFLEQTAHYVPPHAIGCDSMAEDFLNGDMDAECFKAILMNVDENRESVLGKQKALQKIVEKFPRCRAGVFALAATWMQLHRLGEALETLELYHELDQEDAKAEYYLAALHGVRHNYPKAWEHLRQAETITKAHNYMPKILKKFRRELSGECPE